jgi:pSer/pThr/pTyr-binding forkhead associated (FHA) protein
MYDWACILSAINGDLRGRAYVITSGGRCVIGRSSDCAINLACSSDYVSISRHHCALELAPPHVHARDLGSLNGTYVNEDRIGKRSWRQSPAEVGPDDYASRELKNDDVLRVGDINFRVNIIEPTPLFEPLHPRQREPELADGQSTYLAEPDKASQDMQPPASMDEQLEPLHSALDLPDLPDEPILAS